MVPLKYFTGKCPKFKTVFYQNQSWNTALRFLLFFYVLSELCAAKSTQVSELQSLIHVCSAQVYLPLRAADKMILHVTTRCSGLNVFICLFVIHSSEWESGHSKGPCTFLRLWRDLEADGGDDLGCCLKRKKMSLEGGEMESHEREAGSALKQQTFKQILPPRSFSLFLCFKLTGAKQNCSSNHC